MKKLLIALSVLAVSTSTFAQQQKNFSQVVKVKSLSQYYDSHFYNLETNKGLYEIDMLSIGTGSYKVLKNAAKNKSCVRLTGKVQYNNWLSGNVTAKAVKCSKK